jgi:peroxiredoxin
MKIQMEIKSKNIPNKNYFDIAKVVLEYRICITIQAFNSQFGVFFMAKTPSTMIALGAIAPSFELPDTISGQTIALHRVKSQIATVVMFICNHCPYVKHIQQKIVDVANKYQKQGIVFIAISSNDIEKYPADSPQHMREEAANAGYPFPYLFDASQEVAKAYQAACTPDFYIFNEKLECVYRGRFDNATPGTNHPVTGADLTGALDNILAKKPVNEEQYPSLGCNIKWK